MLMNTELTHEESILTNPPQLILVFDNWRGDRAKERILAAKTMVVRAALAAKLVHSTIYQNTADMPFVACFAGEHMPQDTPGSQKVAWELKAFKIPENKIKTRANTITTNTDLLALHAYARAHGLTNIAIATTPDHVKRTQLEVNNHFQKRNRQDKNEIKIEVISPLSSFLGHLEYRDDLDPKTQAEIEHWITIGTSGELDGNRLQETVATIVAEIPNRYIRRGIQKRLETLGHKHTPQDLERIQRVARKVKDKSAKRQFKQNPDVPYYVPPGPY